MYRKGLTWNCLNQPVPNLDIMKLFLVCLTVGMLFLQCGPNNATSAPVAEEGPEASETAPNTTPGEPTPASEPEARNEPKATSATQQDPLALSSEEMADIMEKYNLLTISMDAGFSCATDAPGSVLEGLNFLERMALESIEISVEDEMEFGRDAHSSVMEEFRIIDSDPRRRKLVGMLNKMTPHIDRKGITYTIHLVDDEWVNAFTPGGGHVYITTGLMDFVDSDDELAGIIGHEIGHVDKGHTVRTMKKLLIAQGLGDVTGEPDLAGLAANIQMMLSAPFGQIDEFESENHKEV